MITGSAVLAACNNGTTSAEFSENTASATDSKTALVNPFVGTESGAADFGTGGGAGNTFPGATRPFGMLQFSPDTYPSTDNFAGGYTYSDKAIRGFSLTHMSGAGCAVYQDISILPTLVAASAAPVNLSTDGLKAEYRARFSHDDEQAEPGYYRVRLDPQSENRAIDVELTATPRSGMARFRFPASKHARVLINVGASAMANSTAKMHIDPSANTVTGSASSGRFCYTDTHYTVYFAAEFDRAFSRRATWQKIFYVPGGTHASDTAILPINYTPVPGGPKSIPGDPSGTAQAGAALTFDTRTNPVVTMRVAISFVSVANALANLHAEVPDWDFDRHRQAAARDWNRELSRIAVSGGSPTQRRIFYTALYHAMVSPNLFSDVNGDYRGFDDRVHHDPGQQRYHNFSGWDIYRSQIPLLAILDPQRTSALVRSLLGQARESGGFLPKWSYANQQTDVQVGDSADPMIAGAYALGARDFDHDEALRLMLRGARAFGRSSNPSVLAGYVQRPGLPGYKQLGYIPFEENIPSGAAAIVPGLVWGSAATTLEYALDDFSIATFADALCRGEEVDDVRKRSDNWRKLLNPATGYLEPRFATGLFNPLFDPASDLGYVEGSGSQYSWAVPQNVAGLIQARGGPEKALRLLDRYYQKVNAGPQSAHAFLGNEPGLSTPWLYAWLGQPWKTQAVVSRALNELYADTPDGMPGNDDLGTLSAWWVLAALGFNPVIPGTDVLALNTPMFAQAVIHRRQGELRITRAGDGPYIAQATLDGAPLDQAWLHYADTAGETQLRYRSTAKPGADWATGPDGHPPSYSPQQSARSCDR